MEVKFIDLGALYEDLKEELDKVLLEVAKSGKYILGEKVKGLEEEIASKCKVKYGIGVASGTDALILSLKALDIGEGDEVITTAYSFVSSASAISLVGAKPVFVDIESDTYNIDVNKIEEKITDKTKAIIPVHLFGHPASMDEIIEIAKKYNLFVIEDSAQALGAIYNDRPVCSFGDLACVSFFPTKNLGAMGDGGMVLTDNEELTQKIKQLRVHGATGSYYFEYLGLNSRLDEIQAAILLVKLPYLSKWNEIRRKNAQIYNEIFSEEERITRPVEKENSYHIYNQYVIRVGNLRDELANYLKKKGIGYSIYYPHPLPGLPIFKEFEYKETEFPNSVEASKTSIALPIHPYLKEEEIIYVAQTILDFFKRN